MMEYRPGSFAAAAAMSVDTTKAVRERSGRLVARRGSELLRTPTSRAGDAPNQRGNDRVDSGRRLGGGGV